MKKYKHVDGFNWVLDINDGGIGNVLASQETCGKDFSYAREKLFMNLLVNSIKPGMVCIDLGCNIGYATMFMIRESGDNGFVYAIEPDEHNLSLFKENIKINDYENKNIEIIRCAISNRDGKTPFWISNRPNLNSINKTSNSVRKEMIECFSLETFCSKRKYPNFIKMDIEGHEVQVLEGGFKYFQENEGQTSFLIEVHPKEYNLNNDFSKILYQYETIGFKIKTLISTPTSNLKPFLDRGYKPDVEILDDGFIRGFYNNVKNEDAIEICTKIHKDVYGGKAVRAILLTRERNEYTRYTNK